MRQRILYFITLAAALAVAGCGGGGGGSNPGSVIPTGPGGSTTSPTPTPTRTPTPTPSPAAISGTAVEYTSSAALAGFTVTVGQTPPPATCLNAESNTSMPCGVVASPLPTVTTSASGAFALTVPLGTYMLTIGKDNTYATLHRTITVTSSGLALGTVRVAALSADEQAWLTDVNNQRATVSNPVSFSNLAIDEFAEEQAHAEANAVATGAQPYGDATEQLFAGYYAAEAAAMYSASGVASEQGAAGAYAAADTSWMSEKANCTNGSWQTCTFSDSTGHYINISNTQNVWVGLGESSTPYNFNGTNLWVYDMIIPTNYENTYPASRLRAPAFSQ